MTAYQQLKREARRVKWPKIYETDLTTHDRAILRKKDAPREFVWVLRECGTNMATPYSLPALLWMEAHYKLSGNGDHWYIFRNGNLEAVPAEDALMWLRESLVGMNVFTRNGKQLVGTVSSVKDGNVWVKDGTSRWPRMMVGDHVVLSETTLVD